MSSDLFAKASNQKGRILAIDYGAKRTGIAVTDEMQMIASGLTTLLTKELLEWLKKYFEKERVERVLIGDPKQMNGEPSESAPLINAFVKKFKISFPDVPIEGVDERFTSKMAFHTMVNSGLKKKQRQNKALIDEISATIMLQDYLSRKNNL